MKRFLLVPLLAALAMFIWGFIYYGVSGIPYKALGTTGDVGPALNELFPNDGTYVLPDPRGSSEVRAEQMKRGHLITVHIKKSGVKEMDPAILTKGFLLEFISCLLLALIVHQAYGVQPDRCLYRFILCLIVGILVTIYSNGGQVIWWQQDWCWHLMTILHDIIAFVLAGAVITFFYKPKAA